MTVSISEVMDILDRADTQAAAADHEQLLQAALAVGTVHSKEMLAQAVDAHVSARSMEAKAGSSITFDFEWDRPTTEADWHRRQIPQGWGRYSRKEKVSAPAKWVGWGMLVLGVVALTTVVRHGGLDSRLFFIVGATLMGTLLGMGVTNEWVDERARRCDAYHPCVLAEKEMKAFLACPTTRAYLRGVRTSAVPQVLQGDRVALQVRWRKHQQETKSQQIETQYRVQLQRQNEQLDALLQDPTP
jgi:hypothetical protein